MKYLRNEPLKKHTSFRIGGPADYFCVPGRVEELKSALEFAGEKRLPIFVIGAGSNLLALDRGFRGLVIKLAGGLDGIEIKGNRARAGAGVYLPRLLRALMEKGLGGLEFLAGIPGTAGGAVVMNAGVKGKEIGRFVERVTVLTKNHAVKTLNKQALAFGYRQSALQKKKAIVTEVVLRLSRSSPRLIKKKMEKYWAKRRETQPLNLPSAGSVFKNPRGKFAGKMLEEAGSKGLRAGDAQVSGKHANFIVNLGNAGARDVLKLVKLLQKKVKTKFKVKLEPEIKIMVELPNDFQRKN